MIVATAGHVDHGKTALVRALTGIDTDRLPEEKRRGLSIELGFAYRRMASGGALGFVDVPGHERFVRHMLAGVSAIDFALIVIAADDGPMPQTREHLAILDLLAVPRGAVALTKADRVSEGRLQEVGAAAADLLSDTGLARAPVFPVASPSGRGVPALLSHLESCAAGHAPRAATGAFRLAIDRRFSLPGAGLIVAGAVVSGSAAVGDRLLLAPHRTPVRVRSLHVNGASAETASAGERCACNVAPIGQRRVEIGRGDWLVAEEAALATRRIDARVRLLPDAPRPLRDARVQLHLGAAAAGGRIATIEGEAIPPGGGALAQILLDREIAAWWGDRFVLRDGAARRTIGGGRVLDPEPPARGRRAPARLAQLAAQQEPSPKAALLALLALSPGGVPLASFRRGRALSAAEWSRVAAEARMIRFGPPAAEQAVAPEAFHAWRDRLLGAVVDRHAREPEAVGPSEAGLFRGLTPGAARPVFTAALADLLREGALVRDGGCVRLPAWRPALGAADSRLWKRIEPLLDAGGLRPPRFRELEAALDAPLAEIEAVMRRAARLGLVAPVSSNRAFPLAAVRQLAAIAEALAKAAPRGSFSAAEFRDRSGVGRNLTIELLEYFDRVGLTRRVAGARCIAEPAHRLFGPEAVAAEGAAA